tara:strand:- start:176 stop:808 length:633 start_codon:yes stop_codon:yes gene_type:complete
MNLQYTYWYFQGVLPEKFCNQVIDLGLSKNEQRAMIGDEVKALKQNKKISTKDRKKWKEIRNSDISWLDEKWIYRTIDPFVQDANKSAGWNFQYDFVESTQFTKYKLNQYYDWHQDSYPGTYSEGNKAGKTRKLSLTCNLSDGDEYIGGELEFLNLSKRPDKKIQSIKCKEILKKGSIIVFPSFVWHRVTPVTKGTRYSLVAWNCGNPFT